MHHPDAHKIEEKMQVVSADGYPIGIVDGLEDGRIKMTRDSGGGVHRFLPVETVNHVRGGVVMLKMSAEEVESRIDTDGPVAAPGRAASGAVSAEAGMLGGQRRES